MCKGGCEYGDTYMLQYVYIVVSVSLPVVCREMCVSGFVYSLCLLLYFSILVWSVGLQLHLYLAPADVCVRISLLHVFILSVYLIFVFLCIFLLVIRRFSVRIPCLIVGSFDFIYMFWKQKEYCILLCVYNYLRFPNLYKPSIVSVSLYTYATYS